jgi:hypothetical protein
VIRRGAKLGTVGEAAAQTGQVCAVQFQLQIKGIDQGDLSAPASIHALFDDPMGAQGRGGEPQLLANRPLQLLAGVVEWQLERKEAPMLDAGVYRPTSDTPGRTRWAAQWRATRKASSSRMSVSEDRPAAPE